MKIHRTVTAFLCVLVALVTSCSQENTKTGKANQTQHHLVVAEDRSLSIEAYLQLGMPFPDRMWTPEDYSQAVRVLKLIVEKDARELPRYESQNSGKLFARISSRDNLAAMLNKNLPLNTRFPLVDGYFEGVKQTMIVYFEPSSRGIIFDVEIIEVLGLTLKLAQETVSMANEFMASIPKDDPKLSVRQEGLARMKDGLVTTFDGAIISLGETNAYQAQARIRLCGYLQETLPPILREFPKSVQTEIPLRIKRMEESESNNQVKKALGNLIKAIAAVSVQ